jgi:DNA-binding MurR/RpiR family transcriptional regulator
MLGTIEDKIKENKDKLTKSDLKFVDYLKNANLNDLMYQSITELSEMCGVGEATILRFCRKIGLKGYQEFKLVLAQELAVKNTGNDEGLAGKIAENMISAIMETKNIIDIDTVKEAVTLLESSKNKFLFGLGHSGMAAAEAKNRLIRIGFHVDAVTDPHFMAIITSTLTKDDVIVLISISGSTKDIIEVAKLAKENGVKIIVLTSHVKSPVAKFADVILYSVRKEGPLEGGSLVSKISQLYLIDVLCTVLTLSINGEADDMIQKTARAVLDKIV